MSFSLFLISVLKFHSVGTPLMRKFDLYFPSDGPLFSRILAWRSVDCVNLTRRIDPKTFRLEFPRYFILFGSSDGSESFETQCNWGTVFTIVTAPLSSLFPFWKIFSAFHLVVLQPCSAGTDTCPLLCIRVSFIELTFGRMPILTRWSRRSTLSNSIRTVGRKILPVWLLPLALLFLDVLLPRVIDGSEGGAAFGVGFGARSSLSCRKLHWSPRGTLAFFFPLVTHTFSSFSAN